MEAPDLAFPAFSSAATSTQSISHCVIDWKFAGNLCRLTASFPTCPRRHDNTVETASLFVSLGQKIASVV